MVFTAVNLCKYWITYHEKIIRKYEINVHCPINESNDEIVVIPVVSNNSFIDSVIFTITTTKQELGGRPDNKHLPLGVNWHKP